MVSRNFIKFILIFLIFAIVIAIPIFILLVTQTNLSLYVIWMITLSGTTFLIYGIDKENASRENNIRSPEVLLHILSLAGGVLGGWAGMYLFRHKTQHCMFHFFLTISTILHIFLIIQFNLF